MKRIDFETASDALKRLRAHRTFEGRIFLLVNGKFFLGAKADAYHPICRELTRAVLSSQA